MGCVRFFLFLYYTTKKANNQEGFSYLGMIFGDFCGEWGDPWLRASNLSFSFYERRRQPRSLRGWGNSLPSNAVTFPGEGGKKLRRLRWFFPPCPQMLQVAVKSLGYQHLGGSELTSRQLRERGREPSQTPKFPAPFPRGSHRVFSVAVALSPSLLGWVLSPASRNFHPICAKSADPLSPRARKYPISQN